MNIIGIRPADKFGDIVVTVRKTPGWIGRLFGAAERVVEYRGSCTVWYYYPSGARCSTAEEEELSDIYTRYGWVGGG